MSLPSALAAGLDFIIEEYNRDDDLVDRVTRTRSAEFRCYAIDKTMVVLGRGSKPELELNLAACITDGLPIFRRRGGGCSVVLDRGNLVISLVLPCRGIGNNPRHFAQLSQWVMDGLAAIGIPNIERRGICDLTLGDRKIGGACIYRTREILFYSVTLLVDADIALLDRYLAHPPREPDYRRGRCHSEFVTTLSSQGALNARELSAQLSDHLCAPR